MNILLISGKFLPIYNKEKRGAIQKLERIYFGYNEKLTGKADKFTIYSPKIAKDNFDSKKLKNATFRNIDLTTKRYHILKYLYAVKHRLQRTKNNEYYIREIIKDIKRRHEENKYDLIIFENEEGSIPIFKKKTKTKTRIVLHLHNDYVNVDRKYSKIILDNCDEVWCVSNFIKNRVKKVDNSTKTIVVPNTFGKFPEPDRTAVAKLKKEYDAQNNTIFLYVGRLLEVKGVRELIEAFNIHNAKNSHSRLTLIGDFGDSQKNRKFIKEIRRSISKNPNISLVGFKCPQEIANYSAIADVQIVPSRCNEAFGLVTLEAMQANIRLIVSDFGAFHEICDEKAIYISKDSMVKDLVAAFKQASSLSPLPKNYYADILQRYSKYNFTTILYSSIHNGQKP